MGFYRQLQDELTRSQEQIARGRAVKKRPDNGNGSAPAALNGTSAAKSRRTRAFTTTTYRVPGLVAPVRQPTGMTCWATVTTMMYGWLRQQSIPIETVMGDIGQVYLDKFKANQGLGSAEKGPFLAKAGLQAEPPMSWSIDGWMQNLRLYGPLWVTTDEDASANFAIHARIIVGMSTDGTPDGTSFQIVDPATATEYHEDLNTFLRKFEEEARTPGRPLRIQVVHWPAGTQPGPQVGSQSQSTGRWSSRSSSFAPFAGSFEAAPLAWGAKVGADFRDRVRAICGDLGCEPDHLMAAMAFETGETFDPAIRNAAGSGATGLIQFMPKTAEGLGTTTTALAGMTAAEQLEYVAKYFRPFKSRLSSLEDVYMAILWPAAVGKANDHVLFSKTRRPKTYEQNRGLDRDGDGNVTKQEASAPVAAKLVKGRKTENAK